MVAVQPPPPFLDLPRRVQGRPVSLDTDDTRAFLSLAGSGSYASAATGALRRAGHTRGHRLLPRRDVATAYRAFAEVVRSWTVETSTPEGRRDVAVCVGRRRAGMLDIAADGTGVLTPLAVRDIPGTLAGVIGLEDRPVLPGSVRGPGLRLEDEADLRRRLVEFAGAARERWPEVGQALRDGTWRVWRLWRAWQDDDTEPAHSDVRLVLDTRAGLIECREDLRDGRTTGARFVPLSPAQVWDHLTDGPDPISLARTCMWRSLSFAGYPATASPLADLRAGRSA